MTQQSGKDLRVISANGEHERGLAITRGCIRVGTGLDELPNDRRLPEIDRRTERGIAVMRALLDQGARFEQLGHDLNATYHRGTVQSAASVFRSCIDVGLVQYQRLGDVCVSAHRCSHQGSVAIAGSKIHVGAIGDQLDNSLEPIRLSCRQDERRPPVLVSDDVRIGTVLEQIAKGSQVAALCGDVKRAAL